MAVRLARMLLSEGIDIVKKLIGIMIYIFILLSSPVALSRLVCDSTLAPVHDQATAYKLRASRCEGFYRSQVSVGTLEVVGLMQGRLDFDPTLTEALQITSPLVTDQTVTVRAVGIPLKTYYRLDAEVAPNGRFHWPVREVLARQRLSGSKIGLFGRLANDPNIYVPLTVGATGSREILLTLRASVDVDKVEWRYAEGHGSVCSKLGSWQEIHHPRGFRSGQAIEVGLPTVKSRQLCVEVAASRKSRGDWLKQMLHVQIGNVW